MAVTFDDQTESTADAVNVSFDSNSPETAPLGAVRQTVNGEEQHSAETDRLEEIPALLGIAGHSDCPETESEPHADQTFAPSVMEDTVETTTTVVDNTALRAELLEITSALQEALNGTRLISKRIDDIANGNQALAQQVKGISLNQELMTAELECINSGANSRNFLSKTFLTISSVVVSLLVAFQSYLFVSFTRNQRLQETSGSLVLGNISSLNRKMAVYDKNLAKSLEAQTALEHAQTRLATAATEKHEAHGSEGADTAASHTIPVKERLNRLRNGYPEKKLIRKETGDWFVYNKKAEECISDVEIIESLNQAYRKIGRSISPSVPMPAHNALCILKPDGKGGTEIIMTKAFIP